MIDLYLQEPYTHYKEKYSCRTPSCSYSGLCPWELVNSSLCCCPVTSLERSWLAAIRSHSPNFHNPWLCTMHLVWKFGSNLGHLPFCYRVGRAWIESSCCPFLPDLVSKISPFLELPHPLPEDCLPWALSLLLPSFLPLPLMP